METPDQPSIKPSEPEQERQFADSVLEQSVDAPKIIELSYIRDTLQAVNLDVDSEGFIITTTTGEYATPYIFVEDLVKEYVRDDDESVFEAFFRPVTDDRVVGNYSERMHLSELHSVIPPSDEIETGKPVSYDWFTFQKLYDRLETGFMNITAWSDVFNSEDVDDSEWIHIALDSEDPLTLTCLNPQCRYSGSVDVWDTDNGSVPQCPDCGGGMRAIMNEGMVTKYVDPAIEMGEKYEVSDYMQQRLNVLSDRVDQLFENDKNKQSGLDDFM